MQSSVAVQKFKKSKKFSVGKEEHLNERRNLRKARMSEKYGEVLKHEIADHSGR